MRNAVRTTSRRLIWALLAGLLMATTVTVAAAPAAAQPQCPEFTLEPCDDGDPGPGPAGPPMEGGNPQVDMGEMVPMPMPNQPFRECRNARVSQPVLETGMWRLAYTYDINITICADGNTIEVLQPARAVPVPANRDDTRLSFSRVRIDIDQAAGVVIASLQATFCPTSFCQLYVHAVRFFVFPWGGQIRIATDFRWIN